MFSRRLAEASAKYLQQRHVTVSRMTMKDSFAVAQTSMRLATSVLSRQFRRNEAWCIGNSDMWNTWTAVTAKYRSEE